MARHKSAETRFMIHTPVEIQRNHALKDPLQLAAGRVRAALAESSAGRERDWSETVGQTLLDVERELCQHRARAQDTDGSLATLDATRPTLLRQWSGLCHEYSELAKSVQRLRTDASRTAEAFQSVGEALEGAITPAPVPPVAVGVPVLGTIRTDAGRLLARLEKSRATETALLIESVATDIGVGD